MRLLLVALAGGLGSLARYGLGGWTQRLTASSLPLGTLVVNVLGCLLIGFLTTAFSARLLDIREEFRIALTVGFLGGFTTFSAFSMETAALIHEGHALRAGWNVLISVGAGLAAVWLGMRLADALA